ncbi:hypothetical protein [Rhizobium leguminosarum]|uniref:hypothetical protein n=1 Tax=Rhizobium leguminosarum TaxID=384 RepID=UPI001C97D32E|nr:hypothetical protein [Rhizobium leguminosarum]MBY5436499.1 hypothetical protein [Rhizobium leguminosarum]
MKIGYSNLLGEHLQAEVIHHKDCEPFQVVCPACREPVFKVERSEDVGGIHYLSHYAAAKSFQDDCELRVSALPSELISQDNRTSRDQRLQYFLQVLRDMVAKDKIYTGSPQKSQSLLNRSKAIGWLRLQHYEMARKLSWSQNDFAEAVSGYTDDLASQGAFLKTAFAAAVQERIAFDMWRSLVSANGRSNYEFLFNHGYVTLLSRLEVAKHGGQPSQPGQLRMYRCLANLVNASRKSGMQTIGEMAHVEVGPPFALEGMTLLGKALSEIMHEMVGALIALPYFDVLKAKALKT